MTIYQKRQCDNCLVGLFLALCKGKSVLFSVEDELLDISYLLDYKLLRVKNFEIVLIVH